MDAKTAKTKNAKLTVGDSNWEFPIYDGSETGEKVYNSLTVIGREIGPGERDLNDAATGNDVLAKLRRWPVTVSASRTCSAGSATKSATVAAPRRASLAIEARPIPHTSDRCTSG